MVRITPAYEGGRLILVLEGRLVQSLLDELRAALKDVSSGAPCTLDLSGLTFLDEPSARELAGLRRNGVSIIGCSPFVASLIALQDQHQS
jgi:anti-anti-sigma regulatory factor